MSTIARYEDTLKQFAKPVRKSKYGNKKTRVEINGEWVTFDSKKEAQRYWELALLEKDGEITELKRQVPYPIVVKGILIGKYVADFTYCEYTRDITPKHVVQVIEDVKGFRTAIYILKKKLVEAIYNIPIRETGLKPKKRKNAHQSDMTGRGA